MKDYSKSFSTPNDAIFRNGKIFFERQKLGSDGAIGKIDGVTSTFLFRTSSNEYTDIYEQRVIVCDSDTSLSRGSYVTEVFGNNMEEVDDRTWLVISQDDVNQISKYAKVQDCNNKIIIQHHELGIQEIPVIFETPTDGNSDSVKTTRLFDEANTVVQLTMQDNDITKSIEHGTRFIFNHDKASVYRLTGKNNLGRPGLMVFTLVNSEYDSIGDNLELNIADYYSNLPNYEVNILNGEEVTLSYPGIDLQLEVECKINGEIVENSDVVYVSDNPLVCGVSEEGLVTTLGVGIASISVTFKGITKAITVEATDSVMPNYEIAVLPSSNTMKTNRELLLNANVYNNGILTSNEEVLWNVENVDGSETEYVSYISEGNLLTLRSHSQYNKEIKVTVTLVSDNTVQTIKTIKIIPLI